MPIKSENDIPELYFSKWAKLKCGRDAFIEVQTSWTPVAGGSIRITAPMIAGGNDECREHVREIFEHVQKLPLSDTDSAQKATWWFDNSDGQALRIDRINMDEGPAYCIETNSKFREGTEAKIMRDRKFIDECLEYVKALE